MLQKQIFYCVLDLKLPLNFSSHWILFMMSNVNSTKVTIFDMILFIVHITIEILVQFPPIKEEPHANGRLHISLSGGTN